MLPFSIQVGLGARGRELNPWRTLGSRLALDHPVLRVEQVTRRRSQGPPHDFIVLHSPDWVNVVPVTADRRVVLIRQWRQGSEGESLEIPGGLVDPGETPQQAGARELMEETGYRAGSMVYLGKVNPNPALFDNNCHSFLALDARPAGPCSPDDSEHIEVVTTPLAELPGLVRRGAITHSLVVTALALLWLREGLAPGAD